MKILTTIDLLTLPSLETPPTGHIGFGAKADGLYQKIGTTETKLSVDGHTHTFASLISKPTTLAGYGITDAASSTHTHAYLPLAGGTVTGDTTFANILRANSALSLSGLSFWNVVNYNSTGTPTIIRINTRIPYTSGALMPTVHLSGYAYGQAAPIELKVSWYVYNGNYINVGATCNGAWKPTIYLTNEGGYCSINLVGSIYYPRFTIDFFDNWDGADRTGWATGWTVESITTLGTVNQILVPYRDAYLSADTTGNAATATKLQTARTINGVAFDGSANITITAATPATLTRGSYLTGSNFNGSAATTWAVDATSANTASKVVARDASGNFSAGTITAALNGNASTATVATKLGTATVGGTVKPFYLNAGVPTDFDTTVGSATLPVYMNAGSITACSSFGGVTGIGTATPLMDGTASVGTSTLAARQDHRHPTDTSRAAVGQTMYIGTTAVAINRASGTLNLAGIGSLAMGGALTGVTTLTASTSVTVPKVIFAVGGWSVEQTGTEIQFKYNGVIKQRLLSDGSIVAVGEVTAYGATS